MVFGPPDLDGNSEQNGEGGSLTVSHGQGVAYFQIRHSLCSNQTAYLVFFYLPFRLIPIPTIMATFVPLQVYAAGNPSSHTLQEKPGFIR